MGRWEPDARGRLGSAAMDLYLERGFDQTTVADIAERAGLTSRTFFRYFADKREVLFGGSGELRQRMVDALAEVPDTASAMDAVAAALASVAQLLGRDRAFSRQRHSVISANLELQERELIKMAGMGAALAEGLRGRGVPEPQASLAAQAAIGVIHVSFERWLAEQGDADLASVMSDSLGQLRAVTAQA